MTCTSCARRDGFVVDDGVARCRCGAEYDHAACVCGARVEAGGFVWTSPAEGPRNLPSVSVPVGVQAGVGLGTLALGVLALACCCGVLNTDGDAARAREIVVTHLKAPSTAEFIETVRMGPGKYVVTVDAQNGFGAMVRSTFCVVLPEPGRSQEFFECSKAEAGIVFDE